MSVAHVGKVVDGRYRLDRLLGEGAAGAVYAATQLSVDRIVAVKLLHEANTARFAAEARAIAKLNHTNVITLHDFGFDAELGAHFMVTEYAEGVPLSERMTEVMSTDLILQVALEVASALHHAHAKGVLHRDLKPENVILTRADGRVDVAKVLDFGLAQLIEPDDDMHDTTAMPAATGGLPQTTVEIDIGRASSSNSAIPKPPEDEPAVNLPTIDIDPDPSEVEELLLTMDIDPDPSEADALLTMDIDPDPSEAEVLFTEDLDFVISDDSEADGPTALMEASEPADPELEVEEELADDLEGEEDLPEPDEELETQVVAGLDETVETIETQTKMDVIAPLLGVRDTGEEPDGGGESADPLAPQPKAAHGFADRPSTGSIIVAAEDFDTAVIPNLDFSSDSKFEESE